MTSDNQPLADDIADGFSLSAWFIANPDTEGFILAKISEDGKRTYYALKIITSGTSSIVYFTYSIPEKQVGIFMVILDYSFIRGNMSVLSPPLLSDNLSPEDVHCHITFGQL